MSYQLPPIEKLKGRENDDAWKVGVRAYLEDQDLWESVTGDSDDKKKDVKARSKIILLIDPVLYIHVQETETAKEAWENLGKAFEDTGLTRKVGLLRTLISTRLEDCNSAEEYVNKIIQTAYKLNCINMKVSDEWIGAILLAGLPDQYKPMIMGIEGSGIKVTTDAMKTKLLQDISVGKFEKGSAMYGYGNKNSSASGINRNHERKHVAANSPSCTSNDSGF